MKDTRELLSSDLIALRYMHALDAGDLEAVSTLWEEASRDPELEQMLLELDSAMFHEIPGKPRTLSEISRQRTHRWAARAGAIVTLAAACALAILAWPTRETQNQHRNPPARKFNTTVVDQPRDTAGVIMPRLAAHRDLDDAVVPGFVWPLENTLSASTPLDLLD